MDKKKITITIDGLEYKVDAGQTIMQAADACGYRIPRLCYHPKLSIEGACRVCIVQVEGAKNVQTLNIGGSGTTSCSFVVGV